MNDATTGKNICTVKAPTLRKNPGVYYQITHEHRPVKITSRAYHDIVMIMASDYDAMISKCKALECEIEQLKKELEYAVSSPMQPVVNGRFKENKIVSHCLDNNTDMNKLAIHDFSQEDREQFYQLIGYSLGGYADLSQVSDESYYRAEAMNNKNNLPKPPTHKED